MTTIADRLKDLRSQKGVNQDQAAEACNMSRVALARYETGTRVPRAENAARLADYYGVSVDYLLGRDPAPAPVPAQEKAPGERRAEGIFLLEKMTDKQYARALAVLKALDEGQ